MRCKCCNTPFEPSIKRIDGKVYFEELCSNCRSKTDPSGYSPEYQHVAITDRPLELYP